MMSAAITQYRNKTRGAWLTRACLIALLLWAQSAVAQHELDHLSHDASELCQVFSSADHSKAVSTATHYQYVLEFATDKGTESRDSKLELFPVSHPARSPPLNI